MIQLGIKQKLFEPQKIPVAGDEHPWHNLISFKTWFSGPGFSLLCGFYETCFTF